MIGKLLIGVVLFSVPAPLRAQCPGFAPGFGAGGVGDGILDFVRADLGSGPALYAGGDFFTLGGAVAAGVARFDGTSWSALGSGVGSSAVAYVSVVRLVPLDYAGPKLCVIGRFDVAGGQTARGVALWDGASWNALGGGPIPPAGLDVSLSTASVFDGGLGPRLYVGGTLSDEAGNRDPFLASYDGATWTTVLGGPAEELCDPQDPYCLRNGTISSLVTFDDGHGLALFAGGAFDLVAGAPGFNLARFDGTGWSAPSGGIGGADGAVERIVVHDDGRGEALFLQGSFPGRPDPRIARWDGTRFTSLGVSPDATSYDFVSLPAFAGTPAGLWRLSDRPNASSVLRASRWNGASWVNFDFPFGYYGVAHALEVFDSGFGPELVVGGWYHDIGNVVTSGIGAFNGSGWHGFGAGLGFSSETGVQPYVAALAVHDDGTGPALYAGGKFARAGGQSVADLARWDGSRWQPVPGIELPDTSFVRKLLSADVGQGPSLYMAGEIKLHNMNPIPFARWDGHSIVPTGGLVDASDLAVFDAGTGPKLYAVDGTYLMRLDNGFFTPVVFQNGTSLRALAVFDDGAGPALYIGGHFASFAGATCANIVRYDGTSFSAVDSGVGTPLDRIEVLRACDDGGGTKLFAGGSFATASGVAVSNLASWDGAHWADVGGGVGGSSAVVTAIESFDDGTEDKPALFVGGNFASAGGAAAANLARWNGASWTSANLGSVGWNPAVRTLCSVDLPAFGGRTLAIGGDFQALGTAPSKNFGRIVPCDATSTSFCFGDGSARACPCANSGDPSHGCQNSAWTGGALLAFTGTTTPDTAVLHVTGELSHALTIFLQGNTSLAPGVNFGDGLRCAGGNLKRLYAKNASGGAASAPEAGDLSITARSAALGDPIPAGHRRYYQAYYRDGNAQFCPNPPGNAFNVSNGLKLVW